MISRDLALAKTWLISVPLRARAECGRLDNRQSPGAGQGRSRSGVTYKVVLSPSAIRQLRKFDPKVRSTNTSRPRVTFENPGPQLQRARCVRASGGSDGRLPSHRTKFMKEQLLVLSFATGHRREVLRALRFVLGCCCLCRVIFERDSGAARWKSRGRFLSPRYLHSVHFIYS